MIVEEHEDPNPSSARQNLLYWEFYTPFPSWARVVSDITAWA